MNMELRKFENGIEQHNKKIEMSVRQHGLYVIQEETAEVDYFYTVGMEDIDLPELIIHGGNKAMAGQVFGAIYQAKQIGLLDEVSPDTTISGIFTDDIQLLQCDEKKRYFYACRTYYDSWNFDALTVVINQANQETFKGNEDVFKSH